MVRSLKKAASEIAKKKVKALGANTQPRKQRAHRLWPTTPSRRRPHFRFPVRRMNQSVSQPPIRQALAPNHSGPPLYSDPTQSPGDSPYDWRTQMGCQAAYGALQIVDSAYKLLVGLKGFDPGWMTILGCIIFMNDILMLTFFPRVGPAPIPRRSPRRSREMIGPYRVSPAHLS